MSCAVRNPALADTKFTRAGSVYCKRLQSHFLSQLGFRLLCPISRFCNRQGVLHQSIKMLLYHFSQFWRSFARILQRAHKCIAELNCCITWFATQCICKVDRPHCCHCTKHVFIGMKTSQIVHFVDDHSKSLTASLQSAPHLSVRSRPSRWRWPHALVCSACAERSRRRRPWRACRPVPTPRAHVK